MDSVTDQWEQSKKIRSPVLRHFPSPYRRWGCLIGSEIVVVITLTGRIDRPDIQSPDLKVLTSRNKADIKRNTSHSITGEVTNSKDKIALLAVESRHLQIWLKDEYETKLQNIQFSYWVIQHIDVLPAKKFSTFRVSSPLSDVSISCLTGLSKWSAVSCCINSSGIKSRECVVWVKSITSAFWILHSMMKHTTRMKIRELTLREKQAIWMLKEKRKYIRDLAKTKGMEKSRVCKPPTTPATNNYLIGWENNSSWWQTNHKSCEN